MLPGEWWKTKLPMWKVERYVIIMGKDNRSIDFLEVEYCQNAKAERMAVQPFKSFNDSRPQFNDSPKNGKKRRKRSLNWKKKENNMKNLFLLTLLSFSSIFNLLAQETITYVDLTVEVEENQSSKKSLFEESNEKQALLKLVSESIVYPELAEEYNIEGMVVVELTFNEDQTTDIRVKESLGFGCDEVALKTANQYAAAFRKVYARAGGSQAMNIPFRFSLK